MKIKLLFLALLFFTACTPKFSQQAADKTTTTWSHTNDLFDGIIKNPDKNFITHASKYSVIDQEIADLQEMDKARPKSKRILQILTMIQSRFDTYEGEHKAAGNLNNSQAQIFKNGMDALWKSLYRTEMDLNK